MKKFERTAGPRLLAALVAIPGPATAQDERVGPVDAVKIATEADVFGYPLVTFDMVRRQQTNVAAPNADTLYTILWLDVSREPWIVSVPDMGDRYYILPMLDGYSEVFFVASPATTGSKAQTYAVTGPGWSGALPPGVTQVKAPTGMVWILGRVYCMGTPEDYRSVHALQDRFGSVPLSAWGKPWTPLPGVVDPAIDMKTAVRKQVNALGIEAYFDRLAALMKDNPPHPQDAAMVARMARIGVVPGMPFLPGKLDFLDWELIRPVPKLALGEMAYHLKKQKTKDGWLYFTQGVGNFGTDYLLRGMANLIGPGWNRPRDAVYPLSQKDGSGDTYDGARHRYVMRFAKGQLPPANAFWSLTRYDTDFFFVPNALLRFELSPRSQLGTNADGSVDFYFQAESPGKEKEPNWLPAPKGKFALVLRIYAPPTSPPSILDGTWTPPPVKKVQ